MLRLPPELKEELTRMAALNDRSLSKEITIRLKISLGAHGPTLQSILAREALPSQATTPGGSYPISTAAAHPINNVNAAQEKGPAPALSDLDRAMLTVFHQLPVEKQLALLSLFR